MISQSKIKNYLAKLDRSPSRNLISNAIKARGIEDVSRYYSSYNLHPPSLDYESGWESDYSLGGPVSLAYFIISESEIIQNPSFSWLYFWDLLERSNLFLKSVIEGESEINYSNPLSQVFSLKYYSNLFEKHGIVSSEKMPEVYHSQKRDELEDILKRKLRQSAELLKRFAKKSNAEKVLEKHFDKCLNDIFGMLVHSLGTPDILPEKEKNTFENPFKKYELITSINFKNSAYGKVKIDEQIIYNISGNDLLNILIESVKSGEPVMCICETPRGGLKMNCLISDDCSDFNEALATCVDLDKTKRLLYNDVISLKPAVISGAKLKGDSVEIWKLSDKSGNHFVSGDWPQEHIFLMLVKSELLDNNNIINLKDEDANMLKKILIIDS
jgi:aminopeptidase C